MGGLDDPTREAADALGLSRELPLAEDGAQKADGLAIGVERVPALWNVRRGPRIREQHPSPVLFRHPTVFEAEQERVDFFEGFDADGLDLGLHGGVARTSLKNSSIRFAALAQE